MRAIRAACQRVGLDDDARREMQVGLVERGVVQHASMATMSIGDLGKLLDHLNQEWKGPASHRAHIGKIRALWWSLYWLAALNDPSDRAIDTFVRRQTGVSALRFLDHRSAAAVIEALKSWAKREGVIWTKSADALTDRFTVYRELRFRLDRDLGDAAISPLRLSSPDTAWQTHELDAAIKALGKAWRRVSGARAARDA
ncbi:hypothetical protein ASE73_02680 [Sphingomonas sp. Leaf24]|nr:hypothetical protein ASE50_02680 [Sphingomonas sp. Leaf5]KQM96007.1 hypothetical protein ASE73_02680 [Sphingomonas sp. Leaf24]